MQNQTKSDTRLVFIQFIFSSLFSEPPSEDNITDFETYFYRLPVSAIEQKNEFIINFNKNYFKKLALNYIEFINKIDINNIINPFIYFDRKFEKWDHINKSIILSIFSELEITKKDKVKILLNDYFNICKLLITKNELSMINAVTDKYVNEKKII